MIFKNVLLAYQLENYNILRFLKFIYFRPLFWIKWSSRQNIVWTKKIILIAILSVFLYIFWLIYTFLSFTSNIFLSFIFLSIILYPFLLILSSIIISPVDYYLKFRVIKIAKKKIRWLKNLIIIWITWSYWKTSTKEMLKFILSSKYKVISTEWNKNTPLWVSEIILKHLNNSHEVFIVEMWAYKKWDIKKLCDLVNPSIWVLTWITKQHLERFWSIENIIDAKFELIESLPKNWLAVIDDYSEGVRKWLKIKKKELLVKNIIKIWNTNKYKYLDNIWWIEFKYDTVDFKTKLLAPHSINTISIWYEVWKYLWVNTSDIVKSVENIEYTKHRMEPIYNNQTNVWVIDDSYNWNIEAVKSTARFLKEQKIKWKKIYLTPWLTELWNEKYSVHEELWEILSKSINLALLIKNDITESIIKWLLKWWFKKADIITYKDTTSAHNDLWNILQSWDLIVFQNDRTDNYF